MHGGRAVLGADGRPVRLAEPLWDRATHDALVTATAPKRDGKRAPKGREWDAADNARRREMLAEFEVRMVLYPTGCEPRVAITGREISPDGFEMTD